MMIGMDKVTPPPDLRTPYAAATTFLTLLDEDEPVVEELARVVTPEALTYFGDFQNVATFIADIPDMGITPYTGSAPGYPHVAYVKLVSGVTEPSHRRGAERLPAAAVITLVRYPMLDAWLIYHVGDLVPPENLPRPAEQN